MIMIYIFTILLGIMTWSSSQNDSGEKQNPRPDNPALIKLPVGFGPNRIENTPVIFNNRPLLIENSRLTSEKDTSHITDMYIVDLTTTEIISRFGINFAFHCAYVDGTDLNVFATEDTKNEWTASIYRFWTTDLKEWNRELVIPIKKGEHFFNTSVCKGPKGYIMAYESNLPVQWCFRLARSVDLSQWEPIEGLIFADKEEKSVLANPCTRVQ